MNTFYSYMYSTNISVIELNCIYCSFLLGFEIAYGQILQLLLVVVFCFGFVKIASTREYN